MTREEAAAVGGSKAEISTSAVCLNKIKMQRPLSLPMMQLPPAHQTGQTRFDYSSFCSYVDHSSTEMYEPSSTAEEIIDMNNYDREHVVGAFPLKLQTLLRFMATNGMEHIIGWLPHGRSFAIFNPKEFEKIVMKRFFDQSKFSSFIRQLHLYNFKCVPTGGPDAGSYYHEMFLRGKPFLATKMGRTRIKGAKVRKPSREPNLYRYPFMPEFHVVNNGKVNDSLGNILPQHSASIRDGSNQNHVFHAGLDLSLNGSSTNNADARNLFEQYILELSRKSIIDNILRLQVARQNDRVNDVLRPSVLQSALSMAPSQENSKPASIYNILTNARLDAQPSEGRNFNSQGFNNSGGFGRY